MINKISFTGRETMLTSMTKESKNIASNYLCSGKVYSAEERLMAEKANKTTRHPYIAPDKIITDIKSNELIKKAEDVDIDFFSETTPHRFNILG